MTLPKLPEPDCRAYAPQLGAHGNYWLEASVRAIQEEAYRAGTAAAVPDGWKVVPVEPTREMMDAYLAVRGAFQSARSDWAAFLSASPEVK
jgi:hypothetical protein